AALRLLAVFFMAVARDPTDTAAALHERAVLEREAGKPARARRLLFGSLTLFERHEGKGHPDVAHVLIELAAVAQAEGAYREGLGHVGRAVKILAALRGVP